MESDPCVGNVRAPEEDLNVYMKTWDSYLSGASVFQPKKLLLYHLHP